MARRARKRRAPAASGGRPTGSGPAPSSGGAGASHHAAAHERVAASRSELNATAADAGVKTSRSELKNAAARARLEPLAPGERPTAVTVAAFVAAAIGIGNLIAFAAGVKIQGKTPNLGQVLPPVVILLVAAGGLWRARYWAVLGFETLLGILIVYMGVLLAVASNLVAVLVSLGIIVPAGVLFWKLVRAMARLQLPERPQ